MPRRLKWHYIHHAYVLSRRGTPRRYVPRETGESVLNRRIQNGRPRQKACTGSIFLKEAFLEGKEFLITRFHFSKIVVPHRDKDFCPLARLAIARLVGAVPSGASARPPASVPAGSLAFVATWRAALFPWSYRGRSTERRGIPRLGLGGCAPPPPPRPLSLDRQRKGGKKARPWRTSQGLLPATRYALRTCPHTGVARVARTGPRPKAPQPACSR